MRLLKMRRPGFGIKFISVLQFAQTTATSPYGPAAGLRASGITIGARYSVTFSLQSVGVPAMA